VLVAPIIASRFLLDSRTFLLVIIGASNLGSFPFQVHLMWFQNLLPLATISYLPLFEQFVERGTYRLQEIILEQLHDHSFFNIILDMSSHLHQAHLRSYVRPGAGAWLFACLIIPCFYLPLYVFSSTLLTKLSFPHPLILGLTHCVCGELLDPLGIHLF
jgi:hypothetical protein